MFQVWKETCILILGFWKLHEHMLCLYFYAKGDDTLQTFGPDSVTLIPEKVLE